MPTGSWLCMQWPYGKAAQNSERLPQFFGVSEPLPLLLAVILGFQHAAAMVGGIIAATLVVTVLNPDPAITECESAGSSLIAALPKQLFWSADMECSSSLKVNAF